MEQVTATPVSRVGIPLNLPRFRVQGAIVIQPAEAHLQDICIDVVRECNGRFTEGRSKWVLQLTLCPSCDDHDPAKIEIVGSAILEDERRITLSPANG